MSDDADNVQMVPFSFPVVRTLPHVRVPATEAQREIARNSELYRRGDMVLVWVNEGDLISFAPRTPTP